MKRRRLSWRRRALDDLRAVHEWLQNTQRGDSKKTIGRIRATALSTTRLGDIGRPSIEAGLRELSVRNAPYVIVYRIDDTNIDIVAVYHTAQDRERG